MSTIAGERTVVRMSVPDAAMTRRPARAASVGQWHTQNGGEERAKASTGGGARRALAVDRPCPDGRRADHGTQNTANVLNYGMGYELQRYSPLKQINRQTVKRLVPVWNYSYDDNRSRGIAAAGLQGRAVRHDQHARPWRSTPRPASRSGRPRSNIRPRLRAWCAAASSAAASRCTTARSIRTTLDAKVIALDAKTGKELWKSNVDRLKDGYSMTGAPLIADGVVITGISGAEYGTRGFIDGWDPADRQAPVAHLHHRRPDEQGGETWPGDTWQARRRIDLDHRLVRSGAAHRLLGHRQRRARGTPRTAPGDNLYTCSVLALDPKTGKIKWHFQFTPNDPYDYDSVAEMVLVDIERQRQADQGLMDANRNGFFYVLDRTNGKLIAANPYVQGQLGDGHRRWRPAGRSRPKSPSTGAQRRGRSTCGQSMLGGKNWEPVFVRSRRPAWSTPTR